MSAIFGVCYSDGRPARQALVRMGGALEHRGPDGSGMWHAGPVGLGHQMLHTTPESLRERLPLADRSGAFILTADARIDNRAELIASLGLRDRAPAGVSDSDLILAAYERWGERCPFYLLGDFAFAIWDARTLSLFAARDHFGVRAFYYHASAHTFAFATEIKGLLALPELPRTINEARIGDYLLNSHEDQVSTFYQSISRLPPGHCLRLSGGQLRTWRYWELERQPELRLRSTADYAEGYRAHFTEAVRCRMRAAFPVGSMLSGGLDSSSIVTVARALGREQGLPSLHTYSAIFDEVRASDERRYIQAVLDQGGLEPTFVPGDSVTPLTAIEQVLWHQDEPFHAPNLFVNWLIWGRVRQQGVRVLFDGVLGDSTAAHGYEYLDELAYAGRWLRLAREVRALCQVRQHRTLPVLQRYLLEAAFAPRLAEVLQVAHRLRGQPWPAPPIPPQINPAFARRLDLPGRLRVLEGERLHPVWTEREAHFRLLTTGATTSALEALEHAVAAFGIEARLPFLDRRLVEFCLALPSDQKLHRGWNRAMVRHGLADVLPPTVRWRKDKGDLGHNFKHGLAADGARIEQILWQDAELLAPYVDLPALRNTLQRLRAQDQGVDDHLTILLLSVILAVWLRNETVQPAPKEVIAVPVP
ncbi:MAG: lasso peptide isopeptide bond-forming cyclase [Chloroflexi bacterium OHK40]